MNTNLRYLTLVLSISLFSLGQAYGVVILPAVGEQNTNLNTLTRDVPRTYQFVYAASLVDIPVGHQITGMAFRLDGGRAAWPASSRSWANYDIQLSSSLNAPGSLSTTFADNIGTDVVTVRSGPLTFAANSFPGGATPNAFGPEITFTTPFTYQGGHLLITVRHDGNGVDAQFMDAVSAVSGLYEGMWTDSYTASTAVNIDQPATVVRFTTAIPEPSTYAVFFGLVAVGIALCRRRKRV